LFLSKLLKERIAMNQRIGTYIMQKVGGESYKAYIPPKLPPDPLINLAQLYPYLEKATIALANLNTITKSIPNTSLFIYMYVRKEALLSSQIEGTQSSLSDLMLFEHDQKPTVSLDDVEEVSNYVKAIHYGLDRLKNDNFPLSLRLLKEIHGILLSGSRGSTKLPGEFRRSQNWIGGTRPGNALFVPPPVEYLDQSLADFENFLHNDTLPLLIKTAIAHVQFESVHPFLDGNGRLGRLLIVLLLCNSGMLDEPVLYLSLYFKQNKREYYDLLQEVRHNGTWETWIEFFLEGIISTSTQTLDTVKKINKLFESDLAKIESLGRARFSCAQALEYLKQLPQVSVQLLSQELKVSLPTARSSLNHMTRLGITKEISGMQRDKVYVYQKYLNILEERAPLVEAAVAGNVEMVRQLLDSENVNDNDIRDGKTALHWAAQFAKSSSYPFEILELLLKHSDIDVNIRDNKQHTALYYAAESGCFKTVEILAPKTDYESLKKVYDIAYEHASLLSDFKKVREILAAEINSRPEHQEILNEDSKRKERLKQKQLKGYVPCITLLYDLYEKFISSLHDKCLTIPEFEDVIEELSKEENSKTLATFRGNHYHNNNFKAESNKHLQEKHRKLNEEIKKYDNEIIPTYHIIKYLEACGEKIDTITFSSKEQDSLRYDALLSFKNQRICLELTRSIDGKQENNTRQLLRQDGIAFSTVIDNRIKEPVIKDQLHYINNTGEVTYNKETKNSQGNLHKTIFPSKLCFALEQKQQKDYCKEREMYWLVITIQMGLWSEHFNETCKIFYETCLKDKETGFGRIFVFLENNYSPEKIKRIWDSQDPDNVH
jgi:Fic family protein/ankyrin repeat protein